MSKVLTNKIEKILKELKQGLYERDNEINLIMLAMLSGKSIFLYGEPGTAKSMIARRVSLAFKDSEFFSYLMQKFSTPEEIFGPYSIKELRDDKLIRKTEKYLPTADFAFLDEIWKSSPAILNTLLTIINEKIFRNGDEDIKVPLKGIITASNEFPPENQGLEALYDRMIFRCNVEYIKDRDNFKQLLLGSSDSDFTITNHITIKDIEDINKNYKNIKIEDNIFDIIHAIRTKVDDHNKRESENIISISDRRWQKMMEVIRISVYISDRDKVIPYDLLLLKHSIWNNLDEKDIINNIIDESIKEFAPKKTQEYEKYKKEYKELEQEIIQAYYEQEDKYNDIKEYKGQQYFSLKCNVDNSSNRNINLYVPLIVIESKREIKSFIYENGDLLDRYKYNYYSYTYECRLAEKYDDKIKIEVIEKRYNYQNNYQNNYQKNNYTCIIEKICSKGDLKSVGHLAHKNYLKNTNDYINKIDEIIRHNYEEWEKLCTDYSNLFLDELDIKQSLSYYDDFIQQIKNLKMDMENLKAKIEHHKVNNG